MTADDVKCPTCLRPAGVVCENRNTEQGRPRPHAARVRRALGSKGFRK